MDTSGIEPELSAFKSSAIQIRRYVVPELYQKLGFILKCIGTFCSKTRLAGRVLWGVYFRKDNATFKIDIFWNMRVGVDNFKL